MITCNNCGNLFIQCDTRARGVSLHTKIVKNTEVLVTPEYYRIEDTGEESVLDCSCGKTDICFICDYCGETIHNNTVFIVTEPSKRQMVACTRHVAGLPEGYTSQEVEISKMNFIIKEQEDKKRRM